MKNINILKSLKSMVGTEMSLIKLDNTVQGVFAQNSEQFLSCYDQLDEGDMLDNGSISYQVDGDNINVDEFINIEFVDLNKTIDGSHVVKVTAVELL